MLCELNPVYVRNKPNAWVNGFSIIELQDTGDFNVLPVVVSDGKFSYGGQLYGKRK